MTNTLVIAALILGVVVADQMLDLGVLVFLAKRFVTLLDWLIFWR